MSAVVAKQIVLVLLGAAVALAALLGIEVLVALRRDYLPTDRAFVIEGTYGRGRPLRFVVLGDSTAAGLGTDESHAYATVLARRLGETGRLVELTGLGVSGARVRDVLEDQVPDAVAMEPDLIFVGIGANDATHWTPLSDVARYMTGVVAGLKATGAAVVVAGAPDMRAAAFWEPLRSLVGWRGRRVAATIEEVGRGAGVPVVPLADLTAKFFAESPEAHYASDEFHPSAVGYRRWADAIYPYLLVALD